VDWEFFPPLDLEEELYEEDPPFSELSESLSDEE